MSLEHRGVRPAIDPSAYVAPSAVVCGDAMVGPHAYVNGCASGVERGTPPAELMRRQSEFFGAHREDRECG